MTRVRTTVLWVALCSSVAAAAADAQTRCSSPLPPSIGIAVGRSDPYLELIPGAVEVAPPGSVGVNAGTQWAGRLDLPVRGPLRVRLEGATTRWDVRSIRYDPDAGYQVIADESVGSMPSRHVVALVGFRTGHAPACAHISVGGGFYSIGFRGGAVRSPGGALAAGIEIPTGSSGSIQLDGALHLIATRFRDPIAFSTVPALSLTAGWAYRF